MTQLTPREIEILALLAQGKTRKEIALTLAIALGTVNATIQNISNKTGVNKAIRLVNFARDNNIIA